MNSHQRLHAKVKGRVQGVGFRYYVLGAASEIGLVGWVRNRRDGSVEVIAEGKTEILGELVQALERGSRSSAVKEVKTQLQEATGEFDTFFVRGTL